MAALPPYAIRVCRNDETIPPEAEDLFQQQLADSRQAARDSATNCQPWAFLLVCAVTEAGHVLGGVHLDVGPIGGAGPLAEARLAYLERTLVRPEYRRQGLATALLGKAIEATRAVGCEYIRCSNNWDNAAETALFRKCGFALVDFNGESDEEPCYLAVRPLAGESSRTLATGQSAT